VSPSIEVGAASAVQADIEPVAQDDAAAAVRAESDAVARAVGAEAASAVRATAGVVAVGVETDADGRCRFLAGTPLRPVGPPFQATAGRWVGAALGLFATGNGTGAAEFDAVRIRAVEPGAAEASADDTRALETDDAAALDSDNSSSALESDPVDTNAAGADGR
jgi:hypothetical protein